MNAASSFQQNRRRSGQRLLRRGLTAAAVAAVGAGALVAPVTEAQAAPRSTVVVMGDSFTSDIVIPHDSCAQGPQNWPSKLAARTGDRLVNVSCLGAKLSGGNNIYDQAQRAKRANGFHAGTRAVLIQMGFNDANGGLMLYSRCMTTSCPGGEAQFGKITGARFAQRLQALVTYARYYAPNAKIALVGYPEMYASGARDLCFNLTGAPVTVPNTSAAPAFSRRLQSAQEDAAKRLNVDFIDLQAATKGHGMCARDPWIQGVLAPPPADLSDAILIGHPTAHGNSVAARTVQGALRG